MNWGDPRYAQACWLLIPLAVLLVLLYRRQRRRLLVLAQAPAIAALANGWRMARRRQRLVVWWIAMALMTVALARPQWGFRWEDVHRRGLDILILLDTSRSMLAQDIKPNRLEQAKWGVRDLLARLRGDRVGLVTFAGTSYAQCPLTIDYAAFRMTLDDVYCGIVPRGGTAIAHALRTAMDTFVKQSEGERVIILITDGDDHEGNPLQLVDELKRQNVRVFSIGVGSREGELIPAPGGQAGFQKDAAGNTIKTGLNEELLAQLAVATGGTYTRAAPGDLGLERLMDQELSKLARQEGESRMMKAWEERAGWFLGAALLALALEAGLRERRLRRSAA